MLQPIEVKLDPYRWVGNISSDFTSTVHRLGRPSIVFIMGDRREIVPVAMSSFYMQIPTFHFLGGTYSFSHTLDDVARHVISLFSHIMYVEDERARDLLIKSGEEAWRVIVTGSTHFDDCEVREALYEDLKPYDLVLINPVHEQSNSIDNYKQTKREVEVALEQIENYAVLIGPNEDDGSNVIRGAMMKYYRQNPQKCTYWPDGLQRPLFLGALKNCSRFISNSSATLYEAPFFGIEVVNVSQRNSERTIPNPKCLVGGANRIVKHLETVDLQDPRLLWKRVRSPQWQKSIVQQL